MPYLLFWKKQHNLKLPSDAKHIYGDMPYISILVQVNRTRRKKIELVSWQHLSSADNQ